jgi:hypothetical protein
MTDTIQNLVRRFHEEAWNRWDDPVYDALRAEDFVSVVRWGTVGEQWDLTSIPAVRRRRGVQDA